MLARVKSFILQGIDGIPCEIEFDLAPTDLAGSTIVGLPDQAVKESLDRVRSAIHNEGYRFPPGKLLVNLAPAHVRKEGPVYDLPMAVGVLLASGVIRPRDPAPQLAMSGTAPCSDSSVGLLEERPTGDPLRPEHCLIAGELALDGRVRPIRGAIVLASLALELGIPYVIVPAENAAEASVVDGVNVLGVRTLNEVVAIFNGLLDAEPHPPVDVAGLIAEANAEIDFADVKGQEPVKRAITVAAAGGHNLLMLGPPGTGKSMMAKAFPGVLPPMTPEEALEVTRIYSICGRLAEGCRRHDSGLATTRPVRTPHHTASASAVIGGGIVPKPGEITLAHRGILFLDELPEFPRPVLETMRQPLEDHHVTISRAHSSVRFPANFQLIAAMNPTPKGTLPDDANSQREMDRYLARLSGPLIDRIDLHVEVPAVPWKELTGKAGGTSTAQMKDTVLRAREIQRGRQGLTINANLRGRQLDEFAILAEDASALLGQAIQDLGLSARAYDKIRRTALTIADISGDETITVAHIAEAIQYRILDRRA
ncbi:MAG: YifB family Mg chelatase-like AAA ATPase [Phycisphaerales bacterium]